MKPTRKIRPATRLAITDYLLTEKIYWAGELEEVAFLGRLYDLPSMPSLDWRYSSADRDIVQHRSLNNDWSDDWVWDDPRFQLRNAADEEFLAFLALMVHPVVRRFEIDADKMVKFFNQRLRADGWELTRSSDLDGRPVYEGRKSSGMKTAAGSIEFDRYDRLSQPESIRAHLRRIDAGLSSDPPAAIASSKELIETTCKLILDDYGEPYASRDEVMDLYKKVAGVLKLKAEDIPDSRRGSEAAQRALRSLVSVVQSLAELRNAIGLGHGPAAPQPAEIRHARLALNAATGVVEFLLETWHERPAPPA